MMNKTLSAVGAGMALLLASTSAFAAPIVGLYNTGVDASGAVLANGSADTHYSLIATAQSPNSYAVRSANSANGFPIGPWVGDNTTSSWVGPLTDQTLSAPAGSYNYRTTFSLAGLNPATAKIAGRWSVDDAGVDILLNGVSLGIANNNGFQSFTDFGIDSGFVAGLNTLDFVVNNGGGPTGLRVEMTGTAAAVPEPATWAMMVIGFGAVGFTMRSRKRALRFA